MRVSLVYLPCCPVPNCLGKQGGPSGNCLPNLTVRFILSPRRNVSKYVQVLQCMLSVVRLQIVMSQHQRMFQSIVINLEEQNKEMMSRLKQDGASGGGGEGMQMQGPNSIENIRA